ALPILDVSKLSNNRLSVIAGIFDNYANTEFKRIPEQYGDNPDPTRLGFDLEFLMALDPGINEGKSKQCLIELYRRLGIALRTWIDKDA
ncbi:hypothetical protein, partial [Vulcanisaeta souniana]